MREYLSIGFGGALGAIARLSLGSVRLLPLQSGFPVNTLLINVLGSFCLSALLTLFTIKGIKRHIQLGLTTGFLGAFTTFSALCRESVSLLMARQIATALFYIAFSLCLGLSAIYLGRVFIRLMFVKRMQEREEAAE